MAYGALSMTRAKAPFAQREILLKGKNQIICFPNCRLPRLILSAPTPTPTRTSKMIQITFNTLASLCLSTCRSSNYPIPLSEAQQA